jgi:uncharacterized protein
MEPQTTYSAFSGTRRLISGPLESVLREIKQFLQSHRSSAGEPLIFCDQTGKQVDFDFRGSIEELLSRALPAPPHTGPGRPKLGVISREVTLLPRHWEWLECQPNGASAALRLLVDQARKTETPDDVYRARVHAIGRVMSAVAGDLPGFEEAYRALYRRDRARLAQCIEHWPHDIRSYVLERVNVSASRRRTRS